MYISPDASPDAGLFRGIRGIRTAVIEDVLDASSLKCFASPLPINVIMPVEKTKEPLQIFIKSSEATEDNQLICSGRSSYDGEESANSQFQFDHRCGSISTASTCDDFMLGTIYGHPRRITVDELRMNPIPHDCPSGPFFSDAKEADKDSGNQPRLYDTVQYQRRDFGVKTVLTKNLLCPANLGNVSHTVPGSNYVDASLSVRDVDMGNISYDTMSFTADRLIAIGPGADVGDRSYTEDLLRSIFGGDDNSEDDPEVGEVVGKINGKGTEGGLNDSKPEFESDSQDFDVVFGIS